MCISLLPTNLEALTCSANNSKCSNLIGHHLSRNNLLYTCLLDTSFLCSYEIEGYIGWKEYILHGFSNILIPYHSWHCVTQPTIVLYFKPFACMLDVSELTYPASGKLHIWYSNIGWCALTSVVVVVRSYYVCVQNKRHLLDCGQTDHACKAHT